MAFLKKTCIMDSGLADNLNEVFNIINGFESSDILIKRAKEAGNCRSVATAMLQMAGDCYLAKVYQNINFLIPNINIYW